MEDFDDLKEVLADQADALAERYGTFYLAQVNFIIENLVIVGCVCCNFWFILQFVCVSMFISVLIMSAPSFLFLRVLFVVFVFLFRFRS